MSDAQTKPLSKLLQEFAPEERYCVLRDWEDGVATVLRAIPRPDQPRFELSLINPKGKNEKRKVPEELVILSEPATKWLESKRLESRLLIIETTGKFDKIPADIERQPELLNKLAEARRKYLQNQRKPKQASEPTPAKASPKKTVKPTKTAAAKPAQEHHPAATDGSFGNLDMLDKLSGQEKGQEKTED